MQNSQKHTCAITPSACPLHPVPNALCWMHTGPQFEWHRLHASQAARPTHPHTHSKKDTVTPPPFV